MAEDRRQRHTRGGKDLPEHQASFTVGQIVHHRLFDYRGVVIDVDPFFRGAEDWYRKSVRSRPPKDRPWYHVLVDGAEQQTYVAERNLEPDRSGAPVNHPDVELHFEGWESGGYVVRRKRN